MYSWKSAKEKLMRSESKEAWKQNKNREKGKTHASSYQIISPYMM
jgi:hypothetical protein